jgi:uncharacterized protein
MTLDDRTDERPGGSNDSDNPTLAEVMEGRLSRRKVIGGSLALGGLAFLGGPAGILDPVPAAADAARRGRGPLLGFEAVLASQADTIVVADGYVAQVLIPWGTPLHSSGPAWRKDASNTAADQAQQVGMHHDGMHYFPLGVGRRGSERGLLVVNHEYVDRTILYPDGDAVITPDKVAKALAAHGVTVIEIALHGGQWLPVNSRFNRRITGTTPMEFSGPVPTDHPMLQSELGLPPQGTLNNCANGFTPWGTYLACEENWNGYFGTTTPGWSPTPLEARYGVTAAGFGYRWHLAEPRFDLGRNRSELNRFGWVVEVDPFRPDAAPVKRTALGRTKHEGALCVESKNRVVVYMGDDEDGDYFYKFVGSGWWWLQRLFGQNPLDEGTLYVAKLNDDGSGTWLPLAWGEGPLTTANGWADQADVLIRTRQAADAVGATKLDRPEWATVNPKTNDVFLTLTNGTQGVNPPNPRDPNPYGHILKFSHRFGDHTKLTFDWDVWILAGDPAYDPSVVGLDETNIFGSPDGVWVDPDGRLWIETDISNSSQNLAARGYDRIGNNQLLAADPATGEIKRFLVGPRGCEITGIAMTPDQRTLFVNVQHPGETTAFWGTPTPANPRAVSNWPDFDPAGRPRPATVVVRKADGGVIGT